MSLQHEPSFYFRRNWRATFMIDHVAVENRDAIGVENLMWSTDYPHTGTDWPNSRTTIARNFNGLPADEVRKMLHANCKALYRLDDVPQRVAG